MDPTLTLLYEKFTFNFSSLVQGEGANAGLADIANLRLYYASFVMKLHFACVGLEPLPGDVTFRVYVDLKTHDGADPWLLCNASDVVLNEPVIMPIYTMHADVIKVLVPLITISGRTSGRGINHYKASTSIAINYMHHLLFKKSAPCIAVEPLPLLASAGQAQVARLVIDQ